MQAIDKLALKHLMGMIRCVEGICRNTIHSEKTQEANRRASIKLNQE